MTKAEKKLDSVAMMRSARDRISAAIGGMTLEEQLEWLASQEIADPFLRRLRDRAAEQPVSRSDMPTCTYVEPSSAYCHETTQRTP